MKPTLLLVEDEPAIADTLVFALSQAGLHVAHAATLAAARASWLNAVADIVLLDLGLPDGSGLDFCRELRRTSEVPIVILSARSDEVDRIVGLELGADDYVTKPFSPREVSLRVQTILRRAAPRSQPLGKALEITDQRARLAGQWLDLTRRELQLLQVLMRAPGRIFSRDVLLDLVWGQDADSLDRTVDTHIKTLRAKLRSAEPSTDVIVTHRGLGYSLAADAVGR
jgi:two-component system, OmpR family, catabolic regulation response regulator CreB